MNREQKLELLLNFIVDHNNGECGCDKDFMCLAMRYLTGNITLDEALEELS